MPGNYRTVKAYQHAKPFAVACARVACRFPKYEQYALADQLRRAAYSVVLNIAEGASRASPIDGRRLLDVARGSLHEAEVILDIARDLGYVAEEELAELTEMAQETGRTLHGYFEMMSAKAEELKQFRRKRAAATATALLMLLFVAFVFALPEVLKS